MWHANSGSPLQNYTLSPDGVFNFLVCCFCKISNLFRLGRYFIRVPSPAPENPRQLPKYVSFVFSVFIAFNLYVFVVFTFRFSALRILFVLPTTNAELRHQFRT